MKLLLDTHIFLWFVGADPKLRTEWRDRIRDPDNDVFLSVASLWEVIVKHQQGKLPLPEPPEVYLPKMRQAHDIAALSITEEIACLLSTLPQLHKDPFDRILICQALHLGAVLMTEDEAIKAYPIRLVS